jgi:hypothetical protein
MSLEISSEWNIVAPVANGFAIQVSGPSAFHGATRAYTSRSECSSCVMDFARRDGCEDSSRNWRCARWLSYRSLKDAAADCVCGRVRRRVIAHFNRGTGNRSAVRNVPEDVASQFAEPKSDCV